MKKLYILTLFICLAGFGTSFAQTLKGHIYDANTNEPLVGAAVTYKLHGNQGTGGRCRPCVQLYRLRRRSDAHCYRQT